MVDIKAVSAEQTYLLRQRVLRPGRDISTCVFDGDEQAQTRHFAIVDSDETLAIASIYRVDRPDLGTGQGWQLRGMASDDRVRGQGYGKALMAAVEHYVKGRGGDYIWANARVEALGFYSGLQYRVLETLFDIPAVGPHQHVIKVLTSLDVANHHLNHTTS